jgi:hypothetical protein
MPEDQPGILMLAQVDIGSSVDVVFEGIVALPLLASGERWRRGWEIPILWAVDRNSICWLNDGFGGPLSQIDDVNEFLAGFEGREEESTVRQVLGLKPRLPAWVALARQAGWTPPADFDESNYET